MARKAETASLQNQTNLPNPTVSPATTSSQLHANFVKVSIHTAKCDSCEKHNKLTVYRCVECGQHVCSQCWKKPGDGTHVFGGGSHDASILNGSEPIKVNSGVGKKRHENASKTRARRRVQVISDEEDEDDLPVLKPAFKPETSEAIEATKQRNQRTNAIMSGGHHQGHEDISSNLWPMVPARSPPASRPAVPATNTNATNSLNRVVQTNPHLHGDETKSQHQRIGGVYNSIPRQPIYISTREQEPDLPARRPPPQTTSSQQTSRYTHKLARPANYRPQPRSDADDQAADPRNRLAFAPQQNNVVHQAPRPSQASVSHHQPVRPAPRPVPRPAPPPFTISQHHVQTAANINQMSARDRQIAYLREREQAHNKAKLIDVRDRQALTSQQSPRLAANTDQVATHNHPAFISNGLESFAANHEQMMAAREHQRAYLSRQLANRQTSGAAQISVPYQPATKLSPHSAQTSLSPMHVAPSAPRQVQGRLPEIIEAADTLLTYARVEQSPTDCPQLDQAENRGSVLLSPAGQSEDPGSAPPYFHSSSTTLSGPSETTGAQSVSPHNVAPIVSPRDADADSAQARLEKHRKSLGGLQSSSDTRPSVSDTPASEQNHPSPRHAALQPESGTELMDPFASESNGASFRLVQSHPGSTVPTSDRSAAYLNQWNSGRAALFSDSRDSTTDVLGRQPERSHSTIPIVHVQNTTIGKKEPREVAEASTQTSNSPEPGTEGANSADRDTITGKKEQREFAEASTQTSNTPEPGITEANNADVVMGGPAPKIIEDKKSHSSELQTPEDNVRVVVKGRDVEKHPRSEKSDQGRMNKEHKASDDIDIVDARKRDIKDKHPDDDDDDENMEITAWNKLDSEKTIEPHRNSNGRTRDPTFNMRVFKRGVAYVKKPAPKAPKPRARRYLP